MHQYAVRAGMLDHVVERFLGDAEQQRLQFAIEVGHWLDLHRDRDAGSLAQAACQPAQRRFERSEEHTSELQSLMRISYAVFCLKKKKKQHRHNQKSTAIDNDKTLSTKPTTHKE